MAGRSKLIKKIIHSTGIEGTAPELWRLEKRVHPNGKDLCAGKQTPAPFIELGLYQQPTPVSECIVEMQDGYDAKKSMHFNGNTDLDLLEPGKAFWRKGA